MLSLACYSKAGLELEAQVHPGQGKIGHLESEGRKRQKLLAEEYPIATDLIICKAEFYSLGFQDLAQGKDSSCGLGEQKPL